MNAARALGLLDRAKLPLVTTSEAAALWRVRPKAANEMLRRLAAAGTLRRLRRGLWVRGEVDPLVAVERLSEPDVAYVSLLTALRLHGMVDQISPAIQAVTTGRARTIETSLGRFELHHLAPSFFRGFERRGGVALATPAKALIDTLYLSATRDRTLARLPEIHLPRSVSRAALRRWVEEIPGERMRKVVRTRLENLLAS